jgi:hypothetical protein
MDEDLKENLVEELDMVEDSVQNIEDMMGTMGGLAESTMRGDMEKLKEASHNLRTKMESL